MITEVNLYYAIVKINIDIWRIQMKKIFKKKFLCRIKNLKGLSFHIVGIACLIWFLIRVIPKPSRATYPCQRAAFPLAFGFMSWIYGIFLGALVLPDKEKKSVNNTHYNMLAIYFIVAVAAAVRRSQGDASGTPRLQARTGS